MEKECSRLIAELQELSKKYPRMWTVDVIKLITHLRNYSTENKKEKICEDGTN